jgi:DNA replication protein DnaC
MCYNLAMNILIYGKVGSGKTFMATALKQYYESQGQHCDLLEDDGMRANPVGVYFLRGPKAMAKFLKKTSHNETKHFVLTAQMSPVAILRPIDDATESLFDYVYCTERVQRGCQT